MGPALLVSGGQTGVDRAALDAAVALGIPYGGWCPLGGWAEDLPRPPGVLALYPRLRATPSAEPAQRTHWNVRDSDATLVLTRGGRPAVGSGTALTVEVAERLGRPHALAHLDGAEALGEAGALLARLSPGFTLNVAGPRESGAPGIYAQARALLEQLLARA
jgi:hypothetical protein